MSVVPMAGAAQNSSPKMKKSWAKFVVFLSAGAQNRIAILK